MAMHKVEGKNGSMAGKLKIHGGFKAVDQKLASDKKSPRKK